MPKVRLQRILARAGVASRRAAEQLIVEGRVRVGTRVVTELGTKADPRREHIFVNGHRVMAEKLVYVLLHKPRGVVCTLSDPEGRTTVADLLRGVSERVVPIGRLDFETSGVLLLTNDGDFSAALAHPRRKAPKVYVAKVNGDVGDEGLRRWQESIEIDGTPTRPASVKILRHENGKAWLEITLREGKNRHIHRLGEHAGYPVMRLARVEFAGLDCEGLRPGMWRYLTVKELTALKGSYGVPKVIRPPPELGDSKLERVRQKPWRRPRSQGVAKEAPIGSSGARGASDSRSKHGPTNRRRPMEPERARPSNTRQAFEAQSREAGSREKPFARKQSLGRKSSEPRRGEPRFAREEASSPRPRRQSSDRGYSSEPRRGEPRFAREEASSPRPRRQLSDRGPSGEKRTSGRLAREGAPGRPQRRESSARNRSSEPRSSERPSAREGSSGRRPAGSARNPARRAREARGEKVPGSRGRR